MRFEIVIEQPDYPAGVVKQAIENALLHGVVERDFAQGATVRELEE